LDLAVRNSKVSASEVTDYFFGYNRTDDYEEDEDDSTWEDVEYEEDLKDQDRPIISTKIEVNTNECSICLCEFDDKPEIEIFTVNQCKHRFCKECLSGYLSFKVSDIHCLFHHITTITFEKLKAFDSLISAVRIEEKNYYGIACPAHKCRHVLLTNELRTIMNEVELEQFQRFSNLHKQNLEQLQQVAQPQVALPVVNNRACERCFGKSFRSGKYGRIICNKCHTPHCKSCFKKHPKSISCNDYKKSSINILLVDKLKLVRCPKCTALIEKYDGCNFMTCRCTGKFCYLCGITLTDSEHFSHFFDAPFGLKCKNKPQ